MSYLSLESVCESVTDHGRLTLKRMTSEHPCNISVGPENVIYLCKESLRICSFTSTIMLLKIIVYFVYFLHDEKCLQRSNIIRSVHGTEELNTMCIRSYYAVVSAVYVRINLKTLRMCIITCANGI